jgi:hypothetical protein
MSNATIYDMDGYTVTDGLQSAVVCDAARIEARSFARQLKKPVVLVDRGMGETYVVTPDGTITLADEYDDLPDWWVDED